MSTSGRSMDAHELKALGDRIAFGWRDLLLEELKAAGATPPTDVVAVIVLAAASAIAGSYVRFFGPHTGAKMTNRELRDFAAEVLERFLPEAGHAH